MNTGLPRTPNALVDAKEGDRQRLRARVLQGAVSAPTSPVDERYFDALRARVLDGRFRLSPPSTSA